MEILRHFTSSSIAAAAYDRENKVLHVRFTGNDVDYEYENVPLREWRGLERAGSKGRYVNFRIKPFYKLSNPQV